MSNGQIQSNANNYSYPRKKPPRQSYIGKELNEWQAAIAFRHRQTMQFPTVNNRNGITDICNSAVGQKQAAAMTAIAAKIIGEATGYSFP